MLSKLWKMRRPPPAVDQATLRAEEAQACAEAIAALGRLDIDAAERSLQAVLAKMELALTAALWAHTRMVRGDFDEARHWVDIALRLDPNEPAALETLARLYEHQSDPAGEFAARERQLRLGKVKPSKLVAAFRAWRALAEAGQANRKQLDFLIAVFEQVRSSASAAQCVDIANILFAVKAERQRALSILDHHLPPAAGEHRLILSSVFAADLPAAGKARVHSVAETGSPPVECLEFETAASVLPGLQWCPWLPGSNEVVGDVFTRRVRNRLEDPASESLLATDREHVIRLAGKDPTRVERPAVLLGSSTNYYHFIADHLTRLAVLDAIGMQWDGLAFVVGAELAPFQCELYSLLGIPSDRLITLSPDDRFVFAHLIAPLPLVRGGEGCHPLMAQWARRRLVPPVTGPVNLKLYVSRARAGRRRVVNEDEIVSWLTERGFVVMYPEELSVTQQIDLYSRASHVIAPGGGALTNMIFMPPGSSVLMLNNRYLPHDAQQLFFVPMAKACGHRFNIVSGTPSGFTTARVLDADLHVPLQAVQKAVAEWSA